MVHFSRWQLAAALLEYDNDTENPNAPQKKAYDSAIFIPLRKANATIRDLKQPPPESPDFLGVKLPSESGLPSEAGDTRRRSKASVDLLRNPFGEDEEDEQEEEEIDVDLASWGLDSLMPEEKPSKKQKGSKGKAKSEILPSTVGTGRRPGTDRPPHNRTMSVPLAEFGEGGVFLEASGRRNTISDPVNMEEMGILGKPGERQRFSSHPLIESLPVCPPLHSVPSYEEGRDTVPFPSSGQSEGYVPGESRPASRLNLLSEDDPNALPNPFTIPPPPPSRASRFDPKSVAHARTASNATRLSVGPHTADNDEKQAGYSHRAPSRASILDVGTARDRRISAASFGTRDMLDDDFQSAYGGEEHPPRERRYSRLDLMRPKVLVMPSPLQTQSTAPAPVPKTTRTKEGFLDSTDGRPMPPGARASRASMLVPSSVPVPANSFTPNPRLSLSASQLLFRNHLLVDGQRDVSYNDLEGGLQRATEDGEQIKIEIPEEPEKPEKPIGPSLEEEAKRARPAGKLFGRSLIDDLEARKQEIKSKKRVFAGDQRPSMMDRGSLIRASTLIDPSTLPSRPPAARTQSTHIDTTLVRRGSRGGKPLLQIGDNGQIAETNDSRETRMANTKSVFGVDKLWEREMVKLKEIEAQEKVEEEERKKREEEEERKFREKEERKKAKKKRRGKGQDETADLSPLSPSPTSPVASSSVSPQAETGPSLALPDIPKVSSRRRTIPPPEDFESDNESSASEAAPNRDATAREGLADQWVSDDEKKPAASSTTGLNKPRINLPSDDDSDEDIPLSVTLQRAAQKLNSPRSQPVDDDSDEDRPLSMMLLNKTSLASFKVPSVSLSEPANKIVENKKNNDSEDEDNVPLGIRASRLPPGAGNLSVLSGLSSPGAGGKNEDEDDRPLSMHPAQIRKSQFHLFSQIQQQQQQQQQQQMLQAQMTNSMMFSHPPSMMFMMPPAAPTPLVPPAVVPPPPLQDMNKFSSVDRWRHDVAIEQS